MREKTLGGSESFRKAGEDTHELLSSVEERTEISDVLVAATRVLTFSSQYSLESEVVVDVELGIDLRVLKHCRLSVLRCFASSSSQRTDTRFQSVVVGVVDEGSIEDSGFVDGFEVVDLRLSHASVQRSAEHRIGSSTEQLLFEVGLAFGRLKSERNRG